MKRRLSMKFAGLLGIGLMFAIGLSSADAVQGKKIDEEQKNDKRKDVEWTEDETREIRINQSGFIQTFRVHRSNHPNGSQESTITIGTDGPIQIENRLQLPKLGGLELLTGQVPKQFEHLHGKPLAAPRIVVEMKKVNQDKRDRSIGFFAADSWIESKDGRVQIFANQLDLAKGTKKSYWIGVRCNPTTVTQAHDGSIRHQLIVDDVVPESAAEKAGIQPKDLIVRWNEKPLGSVEELVATIQTNQDQKAKVGILRNNRELELEVQPLAREIANQVRTVIVPTAKLNIAQKKIEELQQLVEIENRAIGQQVRVLMVGPGVNFGQEEIELEVDPEIHSKHVHLKKLLDHVADRKFGVFVKGNSFTVKSSPEVQGQLEKVDFEPHEIWETMQVGANGKTFKFQQLAPRMINKVAVDVEVKAENIARKATQNLVNRLKTGQIVFDNPLSTLKQELQNELIELQKENDRIRAQNEELREAIRVLKQELKK